MFAKINWKLVQVVGLVLLGLAIFAGLGYYIWAKNYGPVAVVDGQSITRSDVQKTQDKFNSFYKYSEQSSDAAKLAKKTTIERTLIDTEAKKLGLTVSDSELAAQLKQDAANYKNLDEYLKTVKKDYGFDQADLNTNNRYYLLKQKLSAKVLRAKSVDLIYTRYDVYDNDATKINVAKSEIDAVHGRLVNGEKLSAIATELQSQAAWKSPYSGSNQLDSLNATMAPVTFKGSEDWAEISKMKQIGEVSPVVTSSGGYYGIYVLTATSAGNYDSWDDYVNALTQQTAGNLLNQFLVSTHLVDIAKACKTVDLSSSSNTGAYWGIVYDNATKSAMNGASVQAKITSNPNNICFSSYGPNPFSATSSTVGGSVGYYSMGWVNGHRAGNCWVTWSLYAQKTGYNNWGPYKHQPDSMTNGLSTRVDPYLDLTPYTLSIGIWTIHQDGKLYADNTGGGIVNGHFTSGSGTGDIGCGSGGTCSAGGTNGSTLRLDQYGTGYKFIGYHIYQTDNGAWLTGAEGTEIVTRLDVPAQSPPFSSTAQLNLHSGWNPNDGNPPNALDVLFDRNWTVIAVYQYQPTYTLTVNVAPSGSAHAAVFNSTGTQKLSGGTGDSATQGAATGTVLQAAYTEQNTAYDTPVWSGDCSGTGNNVNVTMNGNKSCTVTFQPIKNNLSCPVGTMTTTSGTLVPTADSNKFTMNNNGAFSGTFSLAGLYTDSSGSYKSKWNVLDSSGNVYSAQPAVDSGGNYQYTNGTSSFPVTINTAGTFTLNYSSETIGDPIYGSSIVPCPTITVTITITSVSTCSIYPQSGSAPLVIRGNSTINTGTGNYSFSITKVGDASYTSNISNAAGTFIKTLQDVGTYHVSVTRTGGGTVQCTAYASSAGGSGTYDIKVNSSGGSGGGGEVAPQ